MNDNLAIAKLLIEKGAHINAKDSDGRTPLHHACWQDNLEIIRFLIDVHHDNVNAKDNEGETPFYHLIGKNPCKYPDARPSWSERLEVAKLLIEMDSTVNAGEEGEKSLTMACESSDNLLELVKFLLENGAVVNGKDNDGEPLRLACQNRNLAVAKLLIENGANVNANFQHWTPLHFASRKGHLEMIKFLVENGSDLNAQLERDGTTPLHWAFRLRGVYSMEIFKVLIQNGADVHAKDNTGQTPLYLACEKGRPDVLQLLLSKGANVNVKTTQGLTPLDVALENTEVVWLLVRQQFQRLVLERVEQ